MSRSFGDHAVHAAGGTSEPEVAEYRVREGGREGEEEEGEGEGKVEEDMFLILASDGLWDVVENQEAVDVVEQFVCSCSSRRGKEGGRKGGEWDAKEAAVALVQFARNRWETLSPQVIDDITCMVVKLPMKGGKKEEETRQTAGGGGGRGRGGGGGEELPLFFPPPQRRMA
jgi:serine/threonine protein phosphatase PrpC